MDLDENIHCNFYERSTHHIQVFEGLKFRPICLRIYNSVVHLARNVASFDVWTNKNHIPYTGQTQNSFSLYYIQTFIILILSETKDLMILQWC